MLGVFDIRHPKSEMTVKSSRVFGLAAIVAAIAAFCSQLYVSLLPYRITFFQNRMLQAAWPVELVAFAIAIIGGLAAVLTERGKDLNKLRLIAIAMAIIVFFMNIYTVGAHSSLYR